MGPSDSGKPEKDGRERFQSIVGINSKVRKFGSKRHPSLSALLEASGSDAINGGSVPNIPSTVTES